MDHERENVYTENVQLRNKFNLIYRMIQESRYICSNGMPTALGMANPIIMEILRISKEEREIEPVIQEKAL